MLQNIAQIDIMTGAFQGLIDAGVLTGGESARYQATFVQPATRYGVTAVVSWVNNTASTELVNNILLVARQAQYAIDFVDTYSSVLNAGINIPGFDNTVEREDLDQAVIDIIGNPKVPSIDYVDTVIAVTVPTTINEEGIFRFAPGKPKG